MTIKVRSTDKSKKLETVENKKIATDSEMANTNSTEDLAQEQPITGRGIFVVQMMENAVSVEGAFLVEDGKLMKMPAVFPNRQYALEQIEELCQIINRNFDEIEGRANA